jgi:hypothetical protein
MVFDTEAAVRLPHRRGLIPIKQGTRSVRIALLLVCNNLQDNSRKLPQAQTAFGELDRTPGLL